MTIDQAVQTGLAHHRAGRLVEAEVVYRQVLAADPNQPEALHLLGVLARNTGKPSVGVDLIRRALAVKPSWHEAWHNLGNALRDSGDADSSVAAFRRALELEPGFADSGISLGSLLIDRGEFDEAAVVLNGAIAARPADARAFNNLGNAMMGKRDFAAAAAAYRQAVRLQPDFVQAMNHLGIALREQGKPLDAVFFHRAAIDRSPRYAEAHRSLGETHRSLGKMDDAEAAYRNAVAIQPTDAAAWSGLGEVLSDGGRLEQSIAAYRSAIACKPGSAEWLTTLGNLLTRTGNFTDAVSAHRQAIAIRPDLAEAHSNLGGVLKDGWRIDEAIAECEKAIALEPDFANAYGNLGQALLLAGRLEESIKACRKVVELDPENADAHGGLVFSMNYDPASDDAAITRELAEWNRRHAEPLREFFRPHKNDPDPDRRLRVGYVSADFWAHPVGRFLLPLLLNHDKTRFEVFAYSQATIADAMTEELKACFDRWQSIVGLSDAQAADQIRRDRIDILVDLSLHTAGNRLLVFARKPAPVQITWLGYPGSSGMSAIDYRISDPYLDLEGSDLSAYSERTLRLPETFWCYRAGPDAGEVAPSPAMARGRVTFGCLNHFGKVTPAMMRVWAQILRNVPESDLLLHVVPGESRLRVIEVFAETGIDPRRLQFEGRMSPRDYFSLYDRIDIALDTSPFAGGTTTCDALWKGVPVVTLRGKTVIGRGGCSILANVGLPELVADTVENYVGIAAGLAADIPRLQNLRSRIRLQMAKSPLMDAPRFARNIESAFRSVWKTCVAGSARSGDG